MMTMMAALRGKKGEAETGAPELTRRVELREWEPYAAASERVAAAEKRLIESQQHLDKIFADHHSMPVDERRRLVEAEKAGQRPDCTSAAGTDALHAAQRQVSIVRQALAELRQERDSLTYAACEALVAKHDLKTAMQAKLQAIVDALLLLSASHADLEEFRSRTEGVKIALPSDFFAYLQPGNVRNPSSLLAQNLATARAAGYSLVTTGRNAS